MQHKHAGAFGNVPDHVNKYLCFVAPEAVAFGKYPPRTSTKPDYYAEVLQNQFFAVLQKICKNLKLKKNKTETMA